MKLYILIFITSLKVKAYWLNIKAVNATVSISKNIFLNITKANIIIITPWKMDFQTQTINVFALRSLPFYKDLYKGGY